MATSLIKRLVIAVFALAGSASVLAQQGQYVPQQQEQTVAPAEPRQRARVHTELGAMYFQAGNLGVALDELSIAIKADPRYFTAYSVRGLVHGALGQNDKAEADFRRALDIAPGDPDVNNNYGWFLCDTGKERQSIAYFLQALKNPLYETPERAYTNAGTCALKAGDGDAALGYLLNAVKIAPEGAPEARYQLARLLFQRGLLDESRVYLNDALRMMEPPTAESLWLGVRLERRLGNKQAENGYVSQLRSRYPTSNEYQEYLKGHFE